MKLSRTIQIIGLILLFFLSYFFGIRNTANLFKECKTKDEKLSNLKSAPSQIASLNSQLSKFKYSIKQNDYNREEIFKSINSFCARNNLKLTKFYPEAREQSNDLEIITNKIIVEGTYKSVVKLAYEIEYIQRLGHLASLNFVKRIDRRKKREFLVGELYLRHLVSV